MSWTGIYGMLGGVPYSFSSEYSRDNWVKKTGGAVHEEKLPGTSISTSRWRLIYQDGGFWMGERIWKPLRWRGFLAWADGRKVQSEASLGATVTLTFEDGAIAVLMSNYEGSYSDVTPGEGILAPSVDVSP